MSARKWTIEGRIMEGYEEGDFELLWIVTSGPKPSRDGDEVEVVERQQGAVSLSDEQWERVLGWLHMPVPPGPAKALDESIIRAINAQRGR
jgi:hypothetical protein